MSNNRDLFNNGLFENDISNNYINNLINTYYNYFHLLPNMLNNTDYYNEQQNMLNNTDYYNEQQNDIISSSLYDEPPFLNVIPDNIENNLKEIFFDKNICKNDKCPITFTDFNIDNKVIMLECSHCFDPDSIKTWLKHHKAECPICRFKLKSIEVNNKINYQHANSNNVIDNNYNYDISLVINNLINNEPTHNSDMLFINYL
jgi:hypothetical protein